MRKLKLVALAVLITLAAALWGACAGSEPAAPAAPVAPPAPQGATAAEVQAAMDQAVQRAMQAAPQGATAADVAAAVQDAMSAQPGVTQADMADAIAQALEARPGVTEAQVASAIASALAERPGVTESQVADAIASALQRQTPGLTEAEVADAITKALEARPGVTQADIQSAVDQAVAKAIPTQAPDDGMMMMGPSGKVTGAVQSVGTSSGWPTDCVWCATFPNIGAGEVLITATRAASGDFITEPWVAESWTLNTDDPDNMYIDWKVREGIQFHKGWGELTAEDVVYTYNAGNPGITPEAKHDTLPRPDIGRMELISKYIARMHLNSFSVSTMLAGISDLGEGVPIMSQRVQSEMGTDWMRQNIILSGPFEVPEWTLQKGIYLEARSDGEHWKGMPHIERFDMIEVPEAATRRAMLESGQAEIADIPIKDWAALIDQGMARAEEGASNARGVLFQGNYWETEHPRTGDALEREIVDKPWISAMHDVAGRERAKDVRTAISQCVDREAILDTILGGQGRVAYAQYIHPDTALYAKVNGDERWSIPFDCEGSRALLAKHGLDGGFTINDYWAGPSGVVVEMAEAMAATWLSELNITVELDRQIYSTWRPGLISRTVNGMHGSFNPGTAPPTWPNEWTWSAVASPAGYNSGNELPHASAAVLAKEKTTNTEELERLTLEWVDFIFDERIGFTVGTMPNNAIYNPNVIASWDMRPMTNFRVGGMKALENIQLK